MFSSKLKSAQRFRNLLLAGDNNYYVNQGSQHLRSLHVYKFISMKTSWYDANPCNKKCEYAICGKNTLTLLHICRQYADEALVKNANVFGDLSYNKYNRIEMDEDEEKEEKLLDNSAKIPRWQKQSPGRYAALIKSHIQEKNLQAALNVLTLVQKNRDKPTLYMYNLLIRAFAVQGDLKQCFKLYNDMKTRAITPTAPTYNSLINACAESKDTVKALEHLHRLREHFYTTEYPLNETHYNSMIKAYSWHAKSATAFELADEMRDKRLPFTDQTYACLLHATVSHKEAGLEHALSIWYIMHHKKIKRDIVHYNLLLRVIRDTKLRKLNPGNILGPDRKTKILISTIERPDLLASPPVFNTLLLQSCKNGSEEKMNKIALSNSNLVIITSEIAKELSPSVNYILTTNPLLLFGGFEKFLDQMEASNVKPDAKTITMIMESVPNSTTIENDVVKYAKKKNIDLDTDCFNILIKKRSIRGQYEDAKAVLNELQIRNLMPNIMTFGVLALGCIKHEDGLELLEQMKVIGYAPNIVIMGALLHRACVKHNFKYILELLNCMVGLKIKPSVKIFEIIQKFEDTIQRRINDKKVIYKRKELRKLKDDFKHFQEEYGEWKERVESRAQFLK